MAVINLNEKMGGAGNTSDIEIAGNLKLLGNGKGIKWTTARSLVAAGTGASDALSLTAVINEVTSTAASTGVIFPTFPKGELRVIANRGANALTVYPPTGGSFVTGSTVSMGSSTCAAFFALADSVIAPV